MTASEGSRPTIVVRAGSPWDGVWRADQHVARRLARRASVLYVDPPLPWTRARAFTSVVEQVEPGLARLRTFVPPGRRTVVGAAVAARVHLSAARRAARRWAPDVDAVLTVSAHFLGALGERRSLFWARDDFVAGAALMGLPARRVERARAHVLAHAHTVVCVSPALAEGWRRDGADAVVVPNGCDAASLAAPGPVDAALAAVAAPRVGLVGTLGDRVDLDLLDAVAALPCSLVLVGPRPRTGRMARFDRLLARANVHWLGSRDHGELAGVLAGLDVGLVPYHLDDFNLASFPLKPLEYLAAGLPVVSTPLPAVASLGPLVTIAEGPEAFASAVRSILRDGDGHAVGERRELADRHSWDRRADALLALVDGRPEARVEAAT